MTFFQQPFATKPGSAGARMSPFWILLQLRMMEVLVTTGAPVKSSPSLLTNQHPTFYRPDAIPVAQPTVSKHWREKVSHSTDLLTPNSSGVLPSLSLTNKGSRLPSGEGCQASRQPYASIHIQSTYGRKICPVP